MLTATVFAALFLVVYVTRFLLFQPKIFAGEGLVRAVYLVILGSHTVLAIAVGPLALVTLRRALQGPVPAPPPDRAGDAPHLALRGGHGLDGVPHAARRLTPRTRPHRWGAEGRARRGAGRPPGRRR